MTDSILVDTDVLIDFFRGYDEAVFFIHEKSERIILSSIVIAELYAGVRGKSERSIIDNFISIFRIIPVDAEIAKAGGGYKRDYGKSHGVGLADAIIAATCDIENAMLATLNVKHYPMLAGIVPAYHK